MAYLSIPRKTCETKVLFPVALSILRVALSVIRVVTQLRSPSALRTVLAKNHYPYIDRSTHHQPEINLTEICYDFYPRTRLMRSACQVWQSNFNPNVKMHTVCALKDMLYLEN